MARQNISGHNETNYREKTAFGSISYDTTIVSDFLHWYDTYYEEIIPSNLFMNEKY